jgi:hypothetical protein
MSILQGSKFDLESSRLRTPTGTVDEFEISRHFCPSSQPGVAAAMHIAMTPSAMRIGAVPGTNELYARSTWLSNQGKLDDCDRLILHAFGDELGFEDSQQRHPFSLNCLLQTRSRPYECKSFVS